MISFNEHEDIKIIEEDKSYNYNEEYSKRHLNRRLYKMESFFRKAHLLEKNEMLDIKNFPQKHIRIDYIQLISYKKYWVDYGEYVHICT